MVSKVVQYFLTLALILCGACSSRENEASALLRKARDLRAEKDLQAAVRLYHEALDRQPELAEAHLELGQIFDQELGDDLRAVYHYERFLEINPKSERVDFVKDLIRAARISYAASIPEARSDLLRQIQVLQREILMLRARLAECTPLAPTPDAGSVVRAHAPAPAPSSTAARPPPQATTSESTGLYTVKKGDSLRTIAEQQLGDSAKWQLIYAANRDRIRSQNQLKVGQQIVIPKR